MDQIEGTPMRKDIREGLGNSIKAAIPSNYGFNGDTLTDALEEITSLEEMIKDLDEIHFHDEIELYSDTVKRLREIEIEIDDILESLVQEKEEFERILKKR